MVIKKLFGNVTNKKIAILGFSFKADTNDTRESPAIFISKKLLVEGALLSIHDPKVKTNQIDLELGDEGKENKSNWTHSVNLAESYENADAIIIITEWEEFNKIDWATISKIMRHPAWLFDTRSFKNSSKASDYGINVWMLGNGLKE